MLFIKKKNPQIIKFEFVLTLLSKLGLNEEWSCKVFNKQMLGFSFKKKVLNIIFKK